MLDETRPEDVLIRILQGHSMHVELDTLGDPLDPPQWAVHTTEESRLKDIWAKGLFPGGKSDSSIRLASGVRQDLHLGFGTDPRAACPSLFNHPCSKLTGKRDTMIWINWGRVPPREAPADAVVTPLKAILTRQDIPPAHLYLAINLKTAQVVAASVAALQYKDEIERALAGQFRSPLQLTWAPSPFICLDTAPYAGRSEEHTS